MVTAFSRTATVLDAAPPLGAARPLEPGELDDVDDIKQQVILPAKHTRGSSGADLASTRALGTQRSCLGATRGYRGRPSRHHLGMYDPRPRSPLGNVGSAAQRSALFQVHLLVDPAGHLGYPVEPVLQDALYTGLQRGGAHSA